MRFLIPVTLWTCVFLLRHNVASAVECTGMNLKYHPNQLMQLTNCTSILGSLIIHSMSHQLNDTDINSFSFPELKEITGYLLIYNVQGLSSVGKLFPNLMVIRGKELALSFSLIIFNNINMTKVGLNSLITIQRGFVLIKQCPALCYHNTIDWEALTDEDEDNLRGGKGNVIQPASAECPTQGSCRSCENDEYCWDSKNCQRDKNYFKNVTINTKNITCDDLCMGGCVSNTTSGCDVCTKWSVNGECVNECPGDLLNFPDIMRCITRQECIEVHQMIPFNGECRSQCPSNHSRYDPVTNEFHKYECFECPVECPLRCPGMAVRGPSDLDIFRECTIVDGQLYINLGSSISDIYEKLEETLGKIETINGVLTVFRSFSLTSLAFFRNLNTINIQNATSTTIGNNETSDEYQRSYGLEIHENDNLQTLFNWKEKPYFKIVGGGISIHYNSKLCMSEYENLRNITEYDGKHDSIGVHTNGYDASCHAIGIYAFSVVKSHSDVDIYCNISDIGANKQLLGYFVYFIEAPSQNITHFTGLDACSTKNFRSQSKTDLPLISKKNHGDVWQNIFVSFEELKMVKGYYEMNLTNLKQYTQYAFYIRTQLSLKVKDGDDVMNVTQGQSPVKYFRTKADRPRPPIVRTKDKTSNSITLEWMPSTPEHELIERYFIDVYAFIEDANEFDNRDYCLNPLEIIENTEEKIMTKRPGVGCCGDERAYLEFFKRDSNQTCGDWDATCEKTFKFVLFHHHVENTLMGADVEKNSSQRHSSIYKREPFEAPPNYKEGSTDPIIRKNESDSTRYYLHSHIINNQYVDSIVVTNLKPFNLYELRVYACNRVANCSDYYFYSDRTHPLPSTDDVNITGVPDEQRSDIVTFTINPPTRPNPYVVAYQIQRRDRERNLTANMCITSKDMERMNYTFRVENLANGLYFYRIRTVSIYGNGLYSSHAAVVLVERPNYSVYTVGTVLAICCIAAIILMCFAYKLIKKYLMGRSSDDGERLLNSSADTDDQSSLQEDGEFKMHRVLPRSAVADYKNMEAKVRFGRSSMWDADLANTRDVLGQSTMQQMLEPTILPDKETPEMGAMANPPVGNPSVTIRSATNPFAYASQGTDTERLIVEENEDSWMEHWLLQSKRTESDDHPVEKPLVDLSPLSQGNASDSDYGDEDYALFN